MSTRTLHLFSTLFGRGLRPRWLLGLGSLALGLGLAGAAHARPWGHGGPGGHGGFFGRGFERLIQELDLSEAQEVEAVRLRRLLREQGEQVHEANRQELKAIAAELKKPNPDRAAIQRSVDTTTARMREMAKAATDALLDFHAKLTPEQKAEVARLIEKREARVEEWRKRRAD